jgi:hypothetical protein
MLKSGNVLTGRGGLCLPYASATQVAPTLLNYFAIPAKAGIKSFSEVSHPEGWARGLG